MVLTLLKLLISYTRLCYRSWLLSVSSFYWVNIVILSFQRSFAVLSLIVFSRLLSIKFVLPQTLLQCFLGVD